MFRELVKRDDGFTLMEVLVVVIIVAILAAVGVPIYTSYVEQARASEAQSAIGAIYNAAKMYYQDTGDWPANVEILEEDGYIRLDRSLKRRWEFEIVSGGEELATIQGISTGEMKGGAGKQVVYDVESGKFSGYGVLGEEGSTQ
ncbi:MAG: Fimbrial protein [Candidatus Marinimicrobia bacterium]|nr:Fimbrial protein [Candidatus Neomarinimicrobiota bacterium]